MYMCESVEGIRARVSAGACQGFPWSWSYRFIILTAEEQLFSPPLEILVTSNMCMDTCVYKYKYEPPSVCIFIACCRL